MGLRGVLLQTGFYFQREGDLSLDGIFLEERVAGWPAGDFSYNSSTAQLGSGLGTAQTLLLRSRIYYAWKVLVQVTSDQVS